MKFNNNFNLKLAVQQKDELIQILNLKKLIKMQNNNYLFLIWSNLKKFKLQI